jgi:hypothetical protein
MLASPRNFTLLFVPDGFNGRISPSLASIVNRQPYPATGVWVLANRVYQALPGYNQGGSTPSTFPTVSAVQLSTGHVVDCQRYNEIPEALQRSPLDPPAGRTAAEAPSSITLKDGTAFRLDDGQIGPASVPPGVEFAPTNPPGIVQFTRPPLAAGADVSTVPPPDKCAGYLGTPTSTTQISLIRLPHVASFVNTTSVDSSTLYPATESAYISFTQYGADVSVYLPLSPFTGSVTDAELKLDATGGATVLVWPRNLSPGDLRAVVAYADQNGWAVMRGGSAGSETTANLLIRIKGAAVGYSGAISNVLCFYGTQTQPMNSKVPWQDLTGAQYVASPANLGAGAPQGVTCDSVQDLVGGNCLSTLRTYIASTGGSYDATS